MIQPEMKFIRVLLRCGHFDRNEILFHIIKYHVNTTQKWIHMKGNICAYVYFIKTKMVGFYWMSRFSWITADTKFHFISPAMKSNGNGISFMISWNFILGISHFGSDVNNLLLVSAWLINNTHREKIVLYWIQYKNSLKCKVGCFWSFLYVYTIN